MMALCMVAFALALGSGKKPNILMIASDGMRPEMSPIWSASNTNSPRNPFAFPAFPPPHL